MGYGYFDACIVYGFKEDNVKRIIDVEFIEKNDLDIFAESVWKIDMTPGEWRSHSGIAPIYGVTALLDEKNGAATVSIEDKERVDKVAKILNLEVGYYLAVRGDYN